LCALLPGSSRAPLLDFAGLARLLAAASLVVAGDTGPLHLADAVGASTLALFGTSAAERNAPAQNGPYRNPEGVVTRMREVSDSEVLDRAVAMLERPLTPAL